MTPESVATPSGQHGASVVKPTDRREEWGVFLPTMTFLGTFTRHSNARARPARPQRSDFPPGAKLLRTNSDSPSLILRSSLTLIFYARNRDDHKWSISPGRQVGSFPGPTFGSLREREKLDHSQPPTPVQLGAIPRSRVRTFEWRVLELR